jgi:L-fucose isomerase-like protein
MTTTRIGFTPLARSTFDIALAEEMTRAARKMLLEVGFELLEPDGLITDLSAAQDWAAALAENPPDLLLIFQATFADSTMVTSLVETVDAPIFLWAVPEDHTGGRLRLNSFCGINLAGHALTRRKVRYDYAFSPPDNTEVLEKITILAKAGRARNLLRSAHLGRVGENPDGFDTCILDADRIKTLFGLEVHQYSLEKDIFPLAEGIAAQTVDEIYARLEQQVEGLGDLEPDATRKTLQVYETLRQVSERESLDGYAVRCWPEFFTELGCAACGAMSMLTDEMTPCSCEADVNGTITQMILGSISEAPAFGTDMVSLDEAQDAVVIWHCGLAPLSMADPQARKGVTVHSNRKLPLLFEFPLKPGRVTIARLTESSGEYRLVVGAGEMVRGPLSFSGTSGLLRFDKPARDVLDTILQEGLEHHISLTYGDHAPEMLALADLLDLPVLKLTDV